MDLSKIVMMLSIIFAVALHLVAVSAQIVPIVTTNENAWTAETMKVMDEANSDDVIKEFFTPTLTACQMTFQSNDAYKRRVLGVHLKILTNLDY